MDAKDDRRDAPQTVETTPRGLSPGCEPVKDPETAPALTREPASASPAPSAWTTDEEDPESREIRRMEALQLADFQDRRRRALQRDRDMEIDMENAARRAGLVPARYPGTLAPVPPAYSNFGCLEFQDEDMDGELSCAGPPPRLRPAAARAGHGAPVPRVSFPPGPMKDPPMSRVPPGPPVPRSSLPEVQMPEPTGSTSPKPGGARGDDGPAGTRPRFCSGSGSGFSSAVGLPGPSACPPGPPQAAPVSPRQSPCAASPRWRC